jgi:hypothetical protein
MFHRGKEDAWFTRSVCTIIQHISFSYMPVVAMEQNESYDWISIISLCKSDTQHDPVLKHVNHKITNA